MIVCDKKNYIRYSSDPMFLYETIFSFEILFFVASVTFFKKIFCGCCCCSFSAHTQFLMITDKKKLLLLQKLSIFITSLLSSSRTFLTSNFFFALSLCNFLPLSFHLISLVWVWVCTDIYTHSLIWGGERSNWDPKIYTFISTNFFP